MRLPEYEKNWAKTEAIDMSFVVGNKRIEGKMHKTQNVRVSDTLSHIGEFIFLNDVKIFSTENRALLVETDFVALSKSSVEFAMEKNNSRVHGTIEAN